MVWDPPVWTWENSSNFDCAMASTAKCNDLLQKEVFQTTTPRHRWLGLCFGCFGTTWKVKSWMHSLAWRSSSWVYYGRSTWFTGTAPPSTLLRLRASKFHPISRPQGSEIHVTLICWSDHIVTASWSYNNQDHIVNNHNKIIIIILYIIDYHYLIICSHWSWSDHLMTASFPLGNIHNHPKSGPHRNDLSRSSA